MGDFLIPERSFRNYHCGIITENVLYIFAKYFTSL